MESSEFGEKFNHDPWASGYDADVGNEAHPIRSGYSAVLDWVAGQVPAGGKVLDLGTGTGNLALRLEEPRELICVDLSPKMMELARQKLGEGPRFVVADLLCDWSAEAPLDAVVSTYAVHHLTEEEKLRLFRHVFGLLKPGGVAAFGDLMFADAAARAEAIAHFKSSEFPDVAEDIEDEFFWYVDAATACFEGLGCAVESRAFSRLSWGLVARKPGA